MSLDFYLDLECESCGVGIHESFNITHNLGAMAREAGVYECLWYPEDNEYLTADNVIIALERGLDRLRTNPEKFKEFDAPNGWGTYKHFLPFVEEVLAACRKSPSASISVSR